MTRSRNAVAGPAWRGSRVIGGGYRPAVLPSCAIVRPSPYIRVGAPALGCGYVRPVFGSCFGFGFGYHPVVAPVYTYPLIPFYGATTVVNVVNPPVYYPPPVGDPAYMAYPGDIYDGVDAPAYVDGGSYVDAGPVVTPAAPQYAETAAPIGDAGVQPQPVAQQAEPTMSVDEINSTMRAGVESFANGGFEDAANAFLRVAMADPQNIDALLAYAIACFAVGDYPASASAIRRGVIAFPSVVDSQFDVRDRYGDASAYEQHLAILEQFVQSEPDSVDGWVVMGFVRHFTGQREISHNTFQMVKSMSADDTRLADIFLNAEPLTQPEDARQPLEQPALPPGSGSPVPNANPNTTVIPSYPVPPASQQGSAIEQERALRDAGLIQASSTRVEEVLDPDVADDAGIKRWYQMPE